AYDRALAEISNSGTTYSMKTAGLELEMGCTAQKFFCVLKNRAREYAAPFRPNLQIDPQGESCFFRCVCSRIEKPRHVMREAGLLLTSIRPATPGYSTRSSLVAGFQLSRFGQSLITALERDHPDRAPALRRGRGDFQVVSWLLLSLLIRDGRAA